MEFHFLPGQNYDCVRCAKGCSAPWRIHVDPYSQRQIKELPVVGESAMYVDEHGATVMARKADGSCVLLGEDKLCQAHAQLGVEAKPIGCRQFPFLIRPTPDGVVVGVSFYCTSVQENSGRPLEAHADEVHEIMKGIRFKSVGDEPIPIWGDHTLDWPTYRFLEEQLGAAIDRHGFQSAIGQMIWALCRLLIAGRQVTEVSLAQTLAEAASINLENDSVIVQQNEFLTAALIAMLESPSPDLTRGITEALLERLPVALPRFAWEGLAVEIEFRREMVGEAFNPVIERYLRALVHRKFLMVERPLLANLAVLYLVPRILRTYTALASLSRQGTEPDLKDLYRALEIVEVDLVTHTRGLDRVYHTLAESFYNQIEALA